MGHRIQFYGTVMPDRTAVVRGRIIDKFENLYTIADLDSISFNVKRKDTGAEVVPDTPLTLADVVYDVPFDWSVDRNQANFLHVIAETVVTVWGITYQVDYTITGADGTVGGGRVLIETPEEA